jgi:hypothetical protein
LPSIPRLPVVWKQHGNPNVDDARPLRRHLGSCSLTLLLCPSAS